MKLSEINGLLNMKVIGQSRAKKRLLATLYINKNSRILLSGPSGCGKTYLINSLADILGIRCCHIDASKLTQTGFAGNTIEDYISEFLNTVGGNLSVVEQSIIFIDEFDKIQSKKNDRVNSEIANIGVQYELLKFFDGDELVIEYNHRKTVINTSKMTVICAGAFSNVGNLISEKEDLVDAGFIEELAGRINVYIPMAKLTREEMLRILEKKSTKFIGNIFTVCSALNEKIVLSNEEMYEIVSKCEESAFGVRHLDDLVYEKLIDKIYEIMEKNDVDM